MHEKPTARGKLLCAGAWIINLSPGSLHLNSRRTRFDDELRRGRNRTVRLLLTGQRAQRDAAGDRRQFQGQIAPLMRIRELQVRILAQRLIEGARRRSLR
jgi:hypothetical protein